MVPTLMIPREDLKMYGYINGYIGDRQREELGDNYIHLLFSPPDMDMFKSFLDDEYEDPSYDLVEDYDYEEGFVVLVYKLNPKWKDDFKLVREGKYSRTSRMFQEIFPKVAKIKIDGKHRDEISLQYKIFKKTTDMIEYWENKLGTSFNPEQEVWSAFDPEKEMLDISQVQIKLKEINQ